MNHVRVLSACTLAALLAACTPSSGSPEPEGLAGTRPAPAGAGAPSPATPSPVAPAPAEPARASASDWCGGHGVPESLCSLCHPQVEARLRAEGNLCPQHRLPADICPGCGKGLPAPGAEPPSDEHDHDHERGEEPDGSASLSDWCGEHGVPESRCTLCDRALAARLQAEGALCAAHGLPADICPGCGLGLAAPTAIALTPEVHAALGLQTVRAEAGDVSVLAWRGVVEAAPEDIAVVAAPREGRVVSITARQGGTLAAGDVVAVIESATAADLAREAGIARAYRDRAEATVERVRLEVASGVAPATALAAAQSELVVAEAEQGAAERAYVATGAGAGGRLPVRASTAGTVVRVGVRLGDGVAAGDELVGLRLPGDRRVRFDVPAAIAGASLPLGALAFEPTGGGRVALEAIRFAPTVDARFGTRTAWGQVDTPLLEGTPGVVVAQAPDCASIPSSSVVPAEGGAQVFVVDGDEARRTSVTVTAQRGATACVAGLPVGAEVVARGALAMAALLDPGTIADGCVDH